MKATPVSCMNPLRTVFTVRFPFASVVIALMMPLTSLPMNNVPLSPHAISRACGTPLAHTVTLKPGGTLSCVAIFSSSACDVGIGCPGIGTRPFCASFSPARHQSSGGCSQKFVLCTLYSGPVAGGGDAACAVVAPSTIASATALTPARAKFVTPRLRFMKASLPCVEEFVKAPTRPPTQTTPSLRYATLGAHV